MMNPGVSKLTECKDMTPKETLSIELAAYGSDDTESILAHDDRLLPYWKKFADALSSVTTSERGYIHLIVRQMQLSPDVSDMLLSSSKAAPLKHLSLFNNNLGSEGISFVTNTLQLNGTLEDVYLDTNHFQDENEVASLISAVIIHPKLNGLALDNCGLGGSCLIKPVLPALERLREVSLEGNSIRGDNVQLISKCLANNPAVCVLDLRDNLLDNEDARALSESLKTNTNLRCLKLAQNRITELGIDCLRDAVYSVSELNAIHDSNHTCYIGMGSNGILSMYNYLRDPVMNRKIKFLSALHCRYNMYYLEHTSIEIMPRILAFVQECNKVT